MKERKDIAVGVFIIVSVGLLIGLLFYFDKIHISNRYNIVKSKFNSVNNLEIGTAVLLGGVKIGKVSDIYIKDDDVIVEMSIKKKIKVYNNSRVVINLKGFIGDVNVNLYNPRNKGKLYNSEKYLKGESPVPLTDLMEKVEKSVETIEKIGQKLNNISFSETEKTFKNINNLVTNLDETVDETKKVMKTSNEIINKNKKNLTELTSKTNKLVDNLNILINTNQEDINKTISLLKDFIKLTHETLDNNDEDINVIINNFKKVTEKLKDLTEKLETDKIEKINEIGPSLLETVGGFKEITQDIKIKLKDLDKGQIKKVIEDTEKVTEDIQNILNNKLEISGKTDINSEGQKSIGLEINLINNKSDNFLDLNLTKNIESSGSYKLILGKNIRKNKIGIGVKNNLFALDYKYKLNNFFDLTFLYTDLDNNNLNIGSDFKFKNTKVYLKYDLDDIYLLGISYEF
ncbi:MAG: MlaD family protein [Fusobacteriota bacterium]